MCQSAIRRNLADLSMEGEAITRMGHTSRSVMVIASWALIQLIVAVSCLPTGAHSNGSSSDGLVQNEWTTETVDTEENSGTSLTLALDSKGSPGIAYCRWRSGEEAYELKFAWRETDGWRTEAVDGEGDVGYQCSLAFDANDKPAIAYLDRTHGRLKFARRGETGWSFQTVDSVPSVFETSLKRDRKGVLFVSYITDEPLVLDEPHELKLARLVDEEWKIEVVTTEGQPMGKASLAFDASNDPLLVYYLGQIDALTVARKKDGAWRFSALPSCEGLGWPSLATDPWGNPGIAFATGSPHWDIIYAEWEGDDWNIATIPQTKAAGCSMHLSFDLNGEPCVSYVVIVRPLKEDALTLAVRTGESWKTEVIDRGPYVGGYNSLAISNEGVVMIAYSYPDLEGLAAGRPGSAISGVKFAWRQLD